MIRVLIADDQALVRGGFRMILDAQKDIAVVGEAADGREAVAQARDLRPDVVLMDIRMPEVDGIEATRRLSDSESTRVLMLTTFDLDEYVYEAMKAGASGFLLKDVRPEQLAEAVRVVAAGEALLAPAITRRLIEEFVRRPAPGSGAPAEVSELTDRELEVLKLVARGLSNAGIASTLFLSEATVKTHVTHILGKLRVRDRVQAVVLAYESGVVRPGADDVTAATKQQPSQSTPPPRSAASPGAAKQRLRTFQHDGPAAGPGQLVEVRRHTPEVDREMALRRVLSARVARLATIDADGRERVSHDEGA